MKYLILLDRKFPYKSGESFLENEIKEIASCFDKVIIFPSDPSKKEEQTRTIESKNVEIALVENKEYKVRKYEYIIKSMFLRLKNDEKTKGIKEKIIEKFFYACVKEQTKKIVKYLENIKFSEKDEIIFYSYWLYISAGVAIELKKYFQKRGIKCTAISRAHGFDIYEENKYLPARKYIVENIDTIYPCSNNGTNYLKERYPMYKNKINTGYLGTYDHGIGKINNNNKLEIVSCSRVTDIKRVNLIVEALSLLENEDINIKWTHIGNGPLLDDVKKLAETKLKRIEFEFLGYIPNTKVYDYYLEHAKDIFINVSSTEGLPVSIMEAISFGIPVIATNVGGTSEIVIDNETGYLLKKDFDVSELSTYIKKIYQMKSNGTYENLRKTARDVWKNNFMAVKNYKKFSDEISIK